VDGLHRLSTRRPSIAFLLQLPAAELQGQITMLGGWMDRILASEDWTRVSKQRAHGSR